MIDIAAVRKLIADSPEWIETENVGVPFMPLDVPTAESKAAYAGMRMIVPACLDEIERLKAGISAALSTARNGDELHEMLSKLLEQPR